MVKKEARALFTRGVFMVCAVRFSSWCSLYSDSPLSFYHLVILYYMGIVVFVSSLFPSRPPCWVVCCLFLGMCSGCGDGSSVNDGVLVVPLKNARFLFPAPAPLLGSNS
jgi:hypothetical protein